MARKWGGTPVPPCRNLYVSLTGSVEGWRPLPSRLRWHHSPAFSPRSRHLSGDPFSPSSVHSHGLFEVKAFKKTTGWGQRKSALQDHHVERASSGSFRTSAIMQLALVAALPKERCDAHFSRNSKELGVFTWERDRGGSQLSLSLPAPWEAPPSSGCPAYSPSLPPSVGRGQGPNEGEESSKRKKEGAWQVRWQEGGLRRQRPPAPFSAEPITAGQPVLWSFGRAQPPPFVCEEPAASWGLLITALIPGPHSWEGRGGSLLHWDWPPPHSHSPVPSNAIIGWDFH